MSIQEAAMIVEHLCAVYPVKYTSKKKRELAAVWMQVFYKEPAGDVWETVLHYISEDTCGYMPVPRNIKERMSKRRKYSDAEEAQEMFSQNWSCDT